MFIYAGDNTPPERVHLRSEHATVNIDTDGDRQSAQDFRQNALRITPE
jgi:hypothetical protein